MRYAVGLFGLFFSSSWGGQSVDSVAVAAIAIALRLERRLRKKNGPMRTIERKLMYKWRRRKVKSGSFRINRGPYGRQTWCLVPTTTRCPCHAGSGADHDRQSRVVSVADIHT